LAVEILKEGKKAIEEIRNKSGSTNVDMISIDMSIQKSIRNGVETFLKSYGRLDILIHNAADFDISRKVPIYSSENIETVWATNHVGPVLLTELLLPLIKKNNGARIITISSKGLMLYPFLKVNLKDPEFREGKYSVEKAYYQSKLAQVMYTYWLAEKLINDKVTVNCIRVTNVKIDIFRYPNLSNSMKKLYSMKSKFSITPEEKAKAYTSLALDDKYKEITGKYFDENLRIVKSSAYSYKKENQEKLMQRTFDFIKDV